MCYAIAMSVGSMFLTVAGMHLRMDTHFAVTESDWIEIRGKSSAERGQTYPKVVSKNSGTEGFVVSISTATLYEERFRYPEAQWIVHKTSLRILA
jgi:heat shock protein HspQ